MRDPIFYQKQLKLDVTEL